MSVQAIHIAASPSVPSNVRPRKGIAVALLLSLALHAVVVLGLTEWFKSAPESPSIVRATLAGSGEGSAIPPPGSTAAPHEMRSVERPLADALPTRTGTPEERPAATPAAEHDSTTPGSPGGKLDYVATVRRIANLNAPNAGADAAAQSRVRRIVEGRTETPEDTWYLESWRRKVERIGKLNYPEQARARNIYGSLRLLVAIEPDGNLRDVRVIDSSGHEVLDDAAVRIVRLAAPYAPFPPVMREDTDVLEIVRTWQFRKRGPSS